MQDIVLQYGAYGLIFFFGLILVLRPLVILTSLIFRPGFLALILLAGLGARAALHAAPAEAAPIVAGSLLAFFVGSGVGLPLRLLSRGGL
ncbi:MAG: hypothetical protein R3D80_16085 [Paracoccaceae bacterium]|nr:hypothetical protein [Maritimibacter sp.]